MGRWPAAWPQTVHLIGVGGVAMSGLAAVLAAQGVRVRGSDKAVYPPASDMLRTAGIDVLTPFAPENLDPVPELIIVGNAISRGNVELERALAERLPLASLAEVIERLLVPGRRVTAVAGTHGKTTTTSMVAYLHHAAGRDPSFLIGGQPGNFDIGARLGGGDDLILEADEYDTAFFDKGPKFLHYWPQIAILGPVEFDHADIYADQAAVERAFALLLRLIPANGTLIVAQDPVAQRLAREARARVVTAAIDAPADLTAVARRDDEHGQTFGLHRAGREIGAVRVALAGEHNARNALAALLALEAAGVALERAADLLSGFKPPRRRLERLAAARGAVLYDDFAHHPTAIAHTLDTLRRYVPAGGRLIACVEPRSNTMTRSVLQGALGEALARADSVWIGPVDRPERFEPGSMLDIDRLAGDLSARGVNVRGSVAPPEICRGVLDDLRAGDVVVVMTNGAFGGLARLLADGMR